MGKVCAVPKCSKLNKIKRSLFKVPSDEIERKRWAAAMPEIKNLKASHFICENHFDEAFIHRRYVKYDQNGRLIAQHVYQRPQLDASAIPNTPAIVNSLPLPVDVGNEVIVSTDTQSCALSVPLSETAEKCASPVSEDFASLELLSPDPENSAFTMQFSEDHTYCAMPVPGNCASPAPLSADPRNCTKTAAVSVDYRNSASTKRDLKGHRNSAALSLQSSLHSPISRIDPGPTKIDVKAVEASSLDGACNKSVEKPDKEPQNEFSAANFQELKISSACLSLGESRATLPKSWTVTELSTQCGKRMIFSYIITLPVADATPAIKKSVTLNLWSGQMYYFVHGTILNPDQKRPLLLQVLDKVESLPNILLRFQHTPVCGGIKPIDTFLMKDDGRKDFLNYWRSNKCLLLTKNRKCAECKRVQSVFKQRQVRYSKNPAISRIGHASNPLDQCKIDALKKKVIRERKMKSRAQHRLKSLNEELEKSQKDLAVIRNSSFEEKCRDLNLSDTQKMVVREIIAAAKKKGTGRRYSEDWLMLCMLMNMRSPEYYEFLRKHDIVPLPSKKTISNYFSLIDNNCGFDEKFAKILENGFTAKTKMKRQGLSVVHEINPQKDVPVRDDDIVDLGNDLRKVEDTSDLIGPSEPLADT